jgi:hypothetical protein
LTRQRATTYGCIMKFFSALFFFSQSQRSTSCPHLDVAFFDYRSNF